MSDVKIRALQAEDAPHLAQIFFDAVHEGTSAFYSEEQRRAWGGDTPDPEGWREKLRDMIGFVAEVDGQPVGFMTIDASGYLDLAFVAPGSSRQGVGRLLYASIERKAKALGARHLTVAASKVAKPFFERQGWSVVEEQSVIRHGVTLDNCRMEKLL